MDPKVLSIVIPTYNMELVLNRCLNSICIETILPKVEIVIVNDGSKDDSLLIAKRYEQKYPDSVMVINKKNGNYGSCINAALKVVTAKYFRILDSDDYFQSEDFVQYVQDIELQDSDLILTNYSQITIDGKLLYSTRLPDHIIGKEVKHDFFSFHQQNLKSMIAMPSMTIKVNSLKDINFYMQEGISYTDTEFCYFSLFVASTIGFMDKDIYRYVIGRDGQTVGLSSILKNYNSYYLIARRLLIAHQSFYQELSEAKRKNMEQCICSVISGFLLATLVFLPRRKDNDDKIKELCSYFGILSEWARNLILNFSYHGIRYVYLYIKFDISIHLLYRVVRMVK